MLVKQAQLIATDVQSAIVPGAGHWLMEEAPGFVIPKLVDFLRHESLKRGHDSDSALTPRRAAYYAPSPLTDPSEEVS